MYNTITANCMYLYRRDSCYMRYSVNGTTVKRINRISIVDNDNISNLLSAKTIQKAGYSTNITMFESAQTALAEMMQLLYTNPREFPDLIFLDITMPEMNGLEFLDEFDKVLDVKSKKCKVVMLSSSINPDEIRIAKSHKAVCDFISKPLTTDKLEEVFSHFGQA